MEAAASTARMDSAEQSQQEIVCKLADGKRLRERFESIQSGTMPTQRRRRRRRRLWECDVGQPASQRQLVSSYNIRGRGRAEGSVSENETAKLSRPPRVLLLLFSSFQGCSGGSGQFHWLERATELAATGVRHRRHQWTDAERN